MGKSEHRHRLPLRVGVYRVGLDAQPASLHQSLDHVNGLPNARRYKMAEHSDVVVGHMAVCDRSHLAIAKVIPGEQILIVKTVLRAVGRNCPAIAPHP